MSINKIEVSIVLSCFNAEKTLLETLKSIEKQSYKNFELIFIDDGSSDNSLKIIEEFLKKSNINSTIISRENKGFLVSLNEGIESSTGNYIARIDSDDLWEPNHLELIMKEFVKNEVLVLVGSNARYINETMEYIGNSNQPVSFDEITKFMLKDNPFIHSSVIFKYEIYKKTQGYLMSEDERGNLSVADYNLWFELSKYGQCMNLDSYTILYRILDNSMSRKMDKYISYTARLSVMQRVYRFYGRYFFFYFFQNIKVRIRILQQCFFRRF